jgi:hypothetical protein
MTSRAQRYWWVWALIWLACWVGFWWAEQEIFPESNGAIGGTLGFIVGAVAAAMIETRLLKKR